MLTNAEQRADDASKRPPFAINLADLRETAAEVLGQIGRFGFFESYTVHSIKHVDEMLLSLEWLIPADTKLTMTLADWFLIVTSIFLHDIGLLVTKTEYDNRAESDFNRFVETRLYAGETGADYKERVQSLPLSERGRFLYEEFVRANHGKRARAWIEGHANVSTGVTQDALDIFQKLFAPLDPLVRADLGLLVESHNLDDIKDTSKYQVKRPYSNFPQDVANLQYCAVVLRTADLLQITKDRAPTTLLKIINPTNPISQTEWVKQNAVRMVCPKVPRNTEGIVDETLPQDTIEVYAEFKEQNGYFGLTALLDYADKQLAESHAIVELSRQRDGCKHSFPWRKIDREHIETKGFLKKEFKFELDQAKILDLLTGHTLYNNGLVVVREIVQNALDAVRLFSVSKTESHQWHPYSGRIQITWNPSARVLEVVDNGTGMSLDVIERHLLRVGASKYQEPEFKKAFPNFFAISRFGIGVLSAFMVADEIQILTTEEGDDVAREISLRSVHSRYLMKVFSKENDAEAAVIGAHGTRFRIIMRPSARTENLLEALMAWVIIPGCEVTFEELGKSKLAIGYPSTSEAVRALLIESGYPQADDPNVVKIVERSWEGFEIAYALRWSDTFKEWNLISAAQPSRARNPMLMHPACICVHGIAVEYATPGYRTPTIVALSNATGARAPRTNVARTILEEDENTEMLGDFAYKTFASAVSDEIGRLTKEEAFTVTKATNEAVYLSYLLGVGEQGSARYPDGLRDTIFSLPVFLIEGASNREKRKAYSLFGMRDLTSFWTVEGEVVKSAESLLAQFKADVTMHSAIEQLSGGQVILPKPLLCNFASLGRFQPALFNEFQITKIEAQPDQKQLAFCWEPLADPRAWFDLSATVEKSPGKDARLDWTIRQSIMANFSHGHLRPGSLRVWAGQPTLQISGLDDYGFIRAYGSLFLLPGRPITSFLDQMCRNEPGQWQSLLIFLLLLDKTVGDRSMPKSEDIHKAMRSQFQTIPNQMPHLELIRIEEFMEAVSNSNLTVYNPFLWSSRTYNVGG